MMVPAAHTTDTSRHHATLGTISLLPDHRVDVDGFILFH